MTPIRGASLPLYVQVKNDIRSRIENGELQPHQALPGERELVTQLGLSRTTIRQALNDLVVEGVLYRQHGKGTFVAPRKRERNFSWLAGFVEELRLMNVTPSVEILAQETCSVPPAIADALRIKPETEIAFVSRRVLTDGVPLFIDRTYLVPSLSELALQSDLTKYSLYNLLERLGYPPQDGLQTIGAIAMHPDDATLLAVPPQSPALFIQRITYVAEDSPIEYSEAVYRADRFQYETRLERRPPGKQQVFAE